MIRYFMLRCERLMAEPFPSGPWTGLKEEVSGLSKPVWIAVSRTTSELCLGIPVYNDKHHLGPAVYSVLVRLGQAEGVEALGGTFTPAVAASRLPGAHGRRC